MHQALQDAQCCRTHNGHTLWGSRQALGVCTALSPWTLAGRSCEGTLSGQHGAPGIWALSMCLSTAADLLGGPQPWSLSANRVEWHSSSGALRAALQWGEG